jgi:hypothetical protein
LSKLRHLAISNNSISNLSPLSSGFSSLTSLTLMHNNISDISALSGRQLGALSLQGNNISDISALSGMTGLSSLGLSGPSITNSSLSALSSLTSISVFQLDGTSVSDISALNSSTELIDLSLTNNKNLSDISTIVTNWNSSLKHLTLTYNNISDVSALAGLQGDPWLDIFELKGNPIPFSQYATLRALYTPPDDIDLNNNPPVFTAGDRTKLIVATNTAADIDIGSPIAATDTEGDTITYSLGGPDAASFSINSATGQLRTKVALNFGTQTSYTVTVDAAGPVSQGGYYTTGLDRITVAITDTATNRAPSFSTSGRVTLSVAENTASGTNIGAPFQATDPDGDLLTYSLQRGDAGSFSIDPNTGQLQTNAALDFETKSSYTDLAVRATDSGGLVGSVLVTVNVTDVGGAAPSIETQVLPETTELLLNYPNPFNPETWIPYQLANPAEVTLTIYDIRGVVVRKLALGHQPAGMYRSRSRAIHWDGRNGMGEKVASGIYFYTLKAGDYFATQKLLIRK